MIMDQINTELQKIQHKGKLAKRIAKECGKNSMSVSNHWLGMGAIPEKYQKDVLRIIKSELKKQSK